ncbi:MAG: toll/interleukin-1 receptor domain-containing protein [Halobacteriota archaeon]
MGVKERRMQFLEGLYNLAAGDDTLWLDGDDIRLSMNEQGYTDSDIYTFAMHFDKLGLVKAEAVIGRRIAAAKLTPTGARYVEEVEGGLEHRYYNHKEAETYSSEHMIFNEGQPCVFLCYARPDGAVVRELYRFLHSKSFRPWMDVMDIPKGIEEERAITSAINNADFFALCLSKNSVHRRGKMRKQLRRAFRKSDEMQSAGIFLIPVRLEECDVRDAELHKFNWVDLFRNDGRERLLFILNEGLKQRGKWSLG